MRVGVDGFKLQFICSIFSMERRGTMECDGERVILKCISKVRVSGDESRCPRVGSDITSCPSVFDLCEFQCKYSRPLGTRYRYR